MHCQEFERHLEARTEGPFPSDAAAHLNDCARCQALAADLEAIEAAARQLAAEEWEPPERLWLSLRSQLESEGLIRPRARMSWLWGWFDALPRPALAGAYLSFLLAAAILLGMQSKPWQNLTANSAEPQPAASVLGTQLSAVENRTVAAMHQHDPAVTASIRQNLDIVDNFIAICEKNVREEPQNRIAREYLYGAYQQKAELLATVTDRGAMGDE